VVSVELRARAELLLRQRRGLLSPPSLVDFVDRVMPGYRWNWHHRLIAEYLERVFDGSVPRLIVCMPPRHGKTQLVSKLFPAWASVSYTHLTLPTTPYV